LVGDEELDTGHDQQREKQHVGCYLQVCDGLGSDLLLQALENLLFLTEKCGVLGATGTHASASAAHTSKVVVISVKDGVQASIAALVGHVLDEKIEILDVAIEESSDQNVVLVLIIEVEFQKVFLVFLVFVFFVELVLL